jgi:site-specific DNA recombinase
MSAQDRQSNRCAIYTRKSSEEGLEQSFNSLDAQREACLAYIESQRQEGWRVSSAHYDDGGYSGGTMERPALKQLLVDIEARKIDIVVVYKVDRLTRSLADFAKIIEVFDARQVSFVSVTQQFNTTSSMGRLTLNVLLSFAQFEREVTGERIRDKIAASKRKGMWMGGNVPLGYDVRDRKLQINEKEAEQVRRIYNLYLKLGCVKKLKAYLDQHNIGSKARVSSSGRKSGGVQFSRGALYTLLQNKTYLGEVPHKKNSYPGEHSAIVDRELWHNVQTLMQKNVHNRRTGADSASPSILRGLLFDGDGNRFTPSHAVKNGVRYRYYISQAVIKNAAANSRPGTRIPARQLEKLVLAEIKAFLNSSDKVFEALDISNGDIATTRELLTAARQKARDLEAASTSDLIELLAETINRIKVCRDSIQIHVSRTGLRTRLLGLGTHIDSTDQNDDSGDDIFTLTTPLSLARRSGELKLIVQDELGNRETGMPATSILKAIARATDWVNAIVAGEYKDQRALAAAIGVNERYVSRIISSAFLAPDIVTAIVEGREISELTLAEILENVPLSWVNQYNRMTNRP